MRRLRPWHWVVISGLALLIVLAGGLTGYAFYVNTRILPHTQISGVEVGGLTKSEASIRLAAKEASFKAGTLTLRYQDKSWPVAVKDLDVKFQNTASLDAAYAVGKSGGAYGQVKDFLASLVRYRYFEADMAPLTPAALKGLDTKVLTTIEVPPTETGLVLVPGKVTVAPGKTGQKLKVDVFEGSLYHDFKSGDTRISLELAPFAPEVTPDEAIPARDLASAILSDSWKLQAGDKVLTISPQDVAGWLTVSVARDAGGQATGLSVALSSDGLSKKVTDFAKTVNVAPVDARLKADGTGLAITVPDKPGLTLTADTSLTKLKTAILAGGTGAARTVAADVVVAQADLRADTITALGIKELVGTGTTDFSGSPSNRITNIARGVELLNGKLVKDGETFSTITSLSPIDQAHGYVQGLVIVNNKTLPADGGGLCQVSTTFFRAVLNAGLPVVARANHSYEVSYYQRGIGPGLDATIYDPNPDFKWKNDTGHAIYVQTYITGKNLTFELYGTRDGRTAAVDGPHTLQTFEPSGDPIYVNTDTLPKGTTKQIDPPVQGAKTTATYTVTRGGTVINTQTFNSFYQAMPAQYLVGTHE